MYVFTLVIFIYIYIERERSIEVHEPLPCLVSRLEVKQHLPPLLAKLGVTKTQMPLAEIEPMDLPDSGSTGMKSFKEMWRCDAAYKTLESCHLYEAGGSLMWVSPLTTQVPCTPPSFAQVKELGQLFRCVPELDRIIYPATIHCYLDSHTDLKPDQFPKGLGLIGGSGLIMAWWLEMFAAMRGDDFDRVKLLWQCALTVTIRLRVACKLHDLTLQALQDSEAMKSKEKLLADSVLTFSTRLNILVAAVNEKTIPKRLAKLIDMKVAFNGSLINRQMLCACEAIENAMTPEVKKCIRDLESQFEKDLLTRSYNKLYKIVTLCSGSEMLSEVLHALAIALGLESVEPKAITEEFLIGPLKGEGKGQGFVQSAILKLKVLGHIERILLAMADQVWTERLLLWVTPSKFYNKIRQASKEQGTSFSDESLLETLVDGELPDKADPLVQLLKGLLQGCYDGELRELLASENPLEDLQSSKDNGLAVEFQSALGALDDDTKNVTEASASAPAVPMRVLARMNSNPDEDLGHKREQALQERREVFQKASSARKGLVQIALQPTPCTAAGIKSLYQKSPAASFKGALNESHRAFFLSMDLVGEAKNGFQGLAGIPPRSTDSVKAKLEFMRGVASPFDLVFVFDGRVRDNRRLIEAELLKNCPESQVAEMWITYTIGKNSRVPGRAVFGSAPNKELGYLKMPVAKVRLNSVDREDTGLLGNLWGLVVESRRN